MTVQFLDLLVALVLIAFAIGGANYALSGTRKRTRRAPYSKPFPAPSSSTSLTDFGQQMHAVMAADFRKRRIMNGSEYRVFIIVEREVAKAAKGYRVFAQTCLGEILESPHADGFRSINAKRVDVLIVDRAGWPMVAIEYQGEGHYQGTAAARDAVKREALRKAGVRYLEIVPDDDDEKIRSRVREYLGAEPVRPVPA